MKPESIKENASISSCCSEKNGNNAEEACCCTTESNSEEETCCCTTENNDTQDSCCCSEESSSDPCCCSEESSSDPCCCSENSDAYSCSDDPYSGEKQDATVDFLYLDLAVCDRCQGADERVFKAIEKCQPVLNACGYNLKLNQVNIKDEKLAEEYFFYSSPTIRVNGVDICSEVEENDCYCCSDISDTDVKCRIFPFNGTYYEVPPTDMLIASIMEIVIKQKTPENKKYPYILPENLREFFEGRRRKLEEKNCC